MAEFCKQCADEMGFEPDFINLFKENQQEPDGDSCFICLCEGCYDALIIDNEGTCGNKDHNHEVPS